MLAIRATGWVAAAAGGRAVGALLALLVLAGAVGGCDPGAKPPSSQPARKRGPAVEVSLTPVTVRPVERHVELTGTLYGDEEAMVGPEVTGRVAAVRVDIGDRVGPAAPLAQIETADFELAVVQKDLALKADLAQLGLSELPSGEVDLDRLPTVQRAQREAANAEARYQRGRQLHDQPQPLISDQDLADQHTAWQVARSNYEVAKLNAQATLAQARTRRADLEIARKHLADTTIRAPGGPGGNPGSTQPAGASYWVASRLVSAGEYVQPGKPLFRLIDDDPVKFRAAVPERHLSQIRVGQEVRLRIAAYPDAFVGQVARVSPQVDPANRTFQVEAVLPNPDRRLKSGAFAKAQVLVGVEPRGLFVPRIAVVSFAGITRVFTVRDGEAQEVRVTTGLPVGDEIEILKGLQGQEQVVTRNAERLASGTPVALAGGKP